jgi:hypothetical protein
MSADTSEQVMALLQELSMLKEMDANPEAGRAGSEPDFQLRQQRKEKIKEQIKALAEQKKNDANQ